MRNAPAPPSFGEDPSLAPSTPADGGAATSEPQPLPWSGTLTYGDLTSH